MSESQQQPKNPDSFRGMHFTLGIMCIMLVLFGLSEVLAASESGSTFKLVLGIVMMVFGGIAAAGYGWLATRNRA